jgi:hypothetical protein
MSVQVPFIPLYPRGRPEHGDVAAFLEEVLIYAHVATAQSILPKASSVDARPMSELTDDEWFTRLDGRTLAVLGGAKRPILVVLTWRSGADDDQSIVSFIYRLYLETRIDRNPTIMAAPEARHIVVLRGAADVRDFERHFMVDEHGVAETIVGRLFIVSPALSPSSREAGTRLFTFLHEGVPNASLRPYAPPFRPADKRRSLRAPSKSRSLKGFGIVSRFFTRKIR